ncbi:hypothetical protein K7Y63_003820 [Serratia marcescens]|nr:hypothetical protein [Serratia marcescens]
MKCVSGIEVMPLLVIAHRVWRWWMLREARRTWQERGDFRKYAQHQGWLIEWQRQRFSTDYCVVRYLVRKAEGSFA